MNEAVLAKFLLQFGAIDEFIKDKFIDTDLYPNVIYNKLEDMVVNYEHVVKEAVEEVYDKVLYDEEKGLYLHPETEEEVYYEDWSEWWTDMRDELVDELVEEFINIILNEVGTTNYDDLIDLFTEEVEKYLQESLDDEWNNYR